MQCPRCDRKLAKEDRFCSRCGLARSTDGVPVDPLIGLTVSDRYRIEERIGVGGMGTVYRAQHIRFGQDVAIKVLHERYTGDEKLARRFEKEALTYGQVSHPNLVGLHDFGRTPDGMFFMALEYCPGKPLSILLRERGQFGWRLATDVVMQVAQGLGAAHDCGVVHRDLKPENVILTEIRPNRYHVRLLDFGIAKREDEDGPRLTQAGMVFGTPEYMSPEQARGKAVDKRSDIYALGTLFYELIVGHPPFHGPDKLRVMQQQANEPPLPPSKHDVEGLPYAMESIILECLEKDPAARIDNTQELLRRIEDCEPRFFTDTSISEAEQLDMPLRTDAPTLELETTAEADEFSESTTESRERDTQANAPFLEGFHDEIRPPATRHHLPILGAVFTIVAVVIGGGLLVRGQAKAPAKTSDEMPALTSETKVKSPLNSVKTSMIVRASKPSSTRKSQTDSALKSVMPAKAQKPTTTAKVVVTPKREVPPLPTQLERALDALDAVRKTKDPKRIRAALTLAEKRGAKTASAKQRQRYASAAKAYLRLQKSRKRAKKKHLKAAQKHLASADFTKAISALKSAQKQGATKAELGKTEAQIQRAKKALTAARKHYAKADCRKTLSSLQPIIEVTPKSKRVAKLVKACRQALPPQRL